MQIIIPMAGHGDRFRSAGYRDPKPLIPIDGKPMIAHVLALFPGETDVLLLCNSDHLAHSALREVLLTLCPSSRIVEIPSHTLGPVQTLLHAEEHIADAEPVLVSYCDYDMRWSYPSFLKFASSTNAAGIVGCYTGFHPHLLGSNFYAGVRADESGRILEIREKYSFTDDKTQSWHSNGLYYFQTGALLKRYCREYRESGRAVNGEYYVSMLYTLMLRDGLDVRVYPIEQFAQWGTPEDLAQYTYWSGYFHERLPCA